MRGLRAHRGRDVLAHLREQPACDRADADEIMITSSRRLVSAVTRLDGRPVRDGRAGPVTSRLFAQMREDIAAAMRAQAAHA
jgi:D-alanine transaminase